jgi:enterochelin esterase family protein
MPVINTSEKIESPTILKLQDDIKDNKKEAILKFWNKIEEKGTNLFEEIEGDDKNDLITFLVREDQEVENIICFSIFVTEDIEEGLLERIDDTNVYFKSYKILKGVRETYFFSKNNPLEPKEPFEHVFKYKDSVFSDPFNSRETFFKVEGIQFPCSEIESPSAPPQPWYGKRTNIDHGKIEKFTSNSEILNNNRQIFI